MKLTCCHITPKKPLCTHQSVGFSGHIFSAQANRLTIWLTQVIFYLAVMLFLLSDCSCPGIDRDKNNNAVITIDRLRDFLSQWWDLINFSDCHPFA